MTDVAEELAVSNSQMYALVKLGQLPAIQVGGRGQWRWTSEAELKATYLWVS